MKTLEETTRPIRHSSKITQRPHCIVAKETLRLEFVKLPTEGMTQVAGQLTGLACAMLEWSEGLQQLVLLVALLHEIGDQATLRAQSALASRQFAAACY